MFETVECPYCGHKNDMSDGLTDLPSDNKFDHECSACEEEFEVEVEFEPSYSSSKIIYEKCEGCSKEKRDCYHKERVFPWPEHLEGKTYCQICYREAYKKYLESQ